jgi:hypothetical protein
MELRLDRLVGRMVRDVDDRRVGRLEEVRIEKRGASLAVTAYVLGRAGLVARLGVGIRLLFGAARPAGYVARWDQLDIGDVEHPRLVCSLEELRRNK